jgi:hypothetical protein
VALAVRIQRDDVVDVIADGTTKDEENAIIDGILMTYGYEYIDATGLIPPQRNTRNVDHDDIEDNADGVFSVSFTSAFGLNEPTTPLILNQAYHIYHVFWMR